MRKKSHTLLPPQDQLRYFPASVVACKATEHPLCRFDEEQEMRQRLSALSATAHTPYLHLEGGRMWSRKQLIRLLGVVFQVDEERP